MSTSAHDFDFLHGTWHTRQRRLKARLQGCDEWESFDATSRVQALPGGTVNFDTLVAEDWRPGWVGMSIRVYHPVTRLWSIHWVTNEGGGLDAASGQLGPPVVGRFEGDEGIFDGDDVLDGRPIRVRFRWQRLGADAARWQQAFSADGGLSSEVNWEMAFERAADAPPVAPARVPVAPIACDLVELRRYTLHPGRREALFELFEREFVETQEAAGMAVMGQFRDLDAPERFVWLRGFPDMAVRSRALAAFYDGPVWQHHRDAANATMLDSDDVHLLRPAWPGAGVAMSGRTRAAGPVRMAPPGRIDLRVLPLREPAGPALRGWCREVATPALQRAGAEVLGWYLSEAVLVVVTGFASAEALDAFERSGVWERELQPEISRWSAGPVECHRLVPGARSALG